MITNYKTNQNSWGWISSSGASHLGHNPLSIIGEQTFGNQICIECALSFLFDKSQLSLRKIKLLDMMKQVLISPSVVTTNVNHIGPLLLSSCLKAIIPSNNDISLKPQSSSSTSDNILEEVIQLWLGIVPIDKLLSRDFPLIVQTMFGELNSLCTNFLCLLVDKVFRQLQDCWNINTIPVEAFSSLLGLLISNLVSTLHTFNKVENEQRSDLLFIILKLCQIMQLHQDCDSDSIIQSVWNGKPIESFVDTTIACLLKADDEDLHINSLAVLHCIVSFDKGICPDFLSIIDYPRLIDALISVVLSPNMAIQIICNQLILELSSHSHDARGQFLNSDISDFLFEALNKDASGEVIPSILAIFHSFLLSGDSLMGTNFLNNFQELGIRAMLKIFPSKVDTFDHLTMSNNILGIFYMYYLDSVEFGLASPQSAKDFQKNFCTLCEQFSNTLVGIQTDATNELGSSIGLNFKTLCEIFYLFQQHSSETSKLLEHLSTLFCNILKSGKWDEFEDGLATFMICAIGMCRSSDSQQVQDILLRIDELILEHVDISFSNGLYDRFLRTCHDYIHLRLSHQKRPDIHVRLMQKKFLSLTINSSSGITLAHKQLMIQLLYCSELLEKSVEPSSLDKLDFSPTTIMSMLQSDLIELGIALLHATMFNNEAIVPANALLSTFSTIILDKTLTNISTLGKLRLSELFVGLSLQNSFSTIPSSISHLVLGWYLECMKLTNFVFKERTSLFVKWASQQESTTAGITRSLISGLINIQTTANNQPQESYLIDILKDARLDLIPTLISLFMENSTSKNTTSQFVRVFSEYFSSEALINEKDSTLVIQKIIEPTLSNIYISLKKGCNTNIGTTLDEITRCTTIILDYSSTNYLSTIFNHYSKIFHSLSDLRLDLKSICLTMNILTKIICLLRSDDQSTRLSTFQVKSNLTRSLQSVERLVVLFGADNNNNSSFVMSVFQLATALLRSMGTSEEKHINETLLKFTIEYLNHDSPLLRILSTCTFHAILSTSIDGSKIWNFNMVYSLLTNIQSNEDLLSLYSIKALYLLEIKRNMSDSILAQNIWNEFIISSVINDRRTEDTFRPSFIVYMCSIMWTCPPQFNQLLGPYFKRDFFKKLIDSANPCCINEWKALVETFLSLPTLPTEDKLFIANYCFEYCSKLVEQSLSSFGNADASASSDIFLHPQLLYEISNDQDISNVLRGMQKLLSKQFQLNQC